MNWEKLQALLIKEINEGIYDNKRQSNMRIKYLESIFPEYKGELAIIVTNLKVMELTRQLLKRNTYGTNTDFYLLSSTPWSSIIAYKDTDFKMAIEREGDTVKVRVEGSLTKDFKTYRAKFLDFNKCYWKLECFMLEEHLLRRGMIV